MGVEGLFMEWIIKALKSNGKAFIVVPDGIFNRQNDKNLRQFIIDECYIDGIVSLPIKTFFTTPKKTYILCLTKKNDKNDIQSHPVFTYLVSEIGESRDAYRFDINDDDLSEAVTLYSFFKGNKTGFAKINTDPRCKIQPIEKFDPDSQWCIERWWSIEEKNDIGISDEALSIGLSEFPDFIEDVSNNLSTINEEVKDLSLNAAATVNVYKKIGEIFDLNQKTNSSKFTKTFINNNQGDIPVYSASKFPDNVDYGYVADNLDGVKYFEDCLTWNIDGSIGRVYFRKGRFSLSEKVIPLIANDAYSKNLDLDYLKFAIENEFTKHYFGFDNKAGKSKIKDIEISIPVDDNGNFDLNEQKKLAERYRKLEQIKKNIEDELLKISSTNIDF